MATNRVTKKVLDYIANINKEAKQMQLTKDLKKEVETGKHGTQKYVVKEGENKCKYANKKYDWYSCCCSYGCVCLHRGYC